MPPRALTFSVAPTDPHRAFLHARRGCRLASETRIRRARADNTTHRLKNAARHSPERLRSLLLGLAAERIARFDLLRSLRATRAPSSRAAEDLPCQGLGRANPLAQPFERPKAPTRLGEILICDLCSRLVATSTHRSLESRARRFRDVDRRFAHCPITRALTRAESGELVADAGMLLPAPPAPGSGAIVRRSRSLRQCSSSPKGEPRVARLKTRGVLVRQRPSRMNVPLTPSVALPCWPAEACRSGSAKDPSSRGAPTPRGCERRGPSSERSADAPTSKPAVASTAATAPAAWPRRGSFRLGLHAHAVRARSFG